jgi:hypothetical protein
MTYSEKNIIGTLVSFSLILLYYVISILGMYRGGGPEEPALVRLWIVVIVLSIIVTIVATILSHIALAVISGIFTGERPDTREIMDERDRLIDLKGTRVNHLVVTTGIFLSMLTFALGKPAVIMFSLLILSSLVAQVGGDLARLVFYRKGV